MKKFLLFVIYCICCLSVFLTFLYFGKLSKIAVIGTRFMPYGLGLIFVLIISLITVAYYREKKRRLEQSRTNNAIKPISLAELKNSPFLLFVAIFFVYCGGILLLMNLRRPNFVLLISGLALTYLGPIVILYWAADRNSRWKLERSRQMEESITLKLRAIRSQLNPHFMFNALTSIQNLMNKNDIAAANHYLSMFAELTRKVLNTSDQELISLEDEVRILDDYLQMEQLRFGFQYEIKADAHVNLANTEIPAMLLQPFVENAIKHGVAVLRDKGRIVVNIDKRDNDIILSVTDNGRGFDQELVRNNKAGFGLKLSEERIALLNEISNDQPVTLNIDPQQGGTRVTITLVNLLS